MSATTTQERHPLGLPKGSIRALMSLSIFGSVMALLLLGREVDVSLWLINYVVLGYYFASRQHKGHPPPTEAEANAPSGANPLHLPRGTVRRLILLAFIGTCGYLIWLMLQSNKAIWSHPSFYPMISLAGFFLGRFFQFVMSFFPGGGSHFRRLHDLKAILGLLSVAALLLLVFLDPDLPSKQVIQRTSLVFIIFYFGSR